MSQTTHLHGCYTDHKATALRTPILIPKTNNRTPNGSFHVKSTSALTFLHPTISEFHEIVFLVTTHKDKIFLKFSGFYLIKCPSYEFLNFVPWSRCREQLAQMRCCNCNIFRTVRDRGLTFCV
jgi:hypothetical protein